MARAYIFRAALASLVLLPAAALAFGPNIGFWRNINNMVETWTGGYLVAANAWVTGAFFSSGGTGDGMMNSVSQVVLDTAGDRMYVADSAGQRVEKFVLSTGAYVGAIGNSTAAGTCVSGVQSGWCTGGVFSAGSGDGMFNTPIAMAIDATGDLFYVVDYSNNRIQKFTLSTGAFVGAIGNSSASGNCASGKQSIWCTNGIFTSGAGDGMFNGPEAIAIDTAGSYMYIVDFTNYRVQRFTLGGAFAGAIGKSTTVGTNCTVGKQSSWCTGGSFVSAAGDGFFAGAYTISIDVAGNLFYVGQGGARIDKFTLLTGAYLGSIGYTSAASGTCVAGKQTGWCTGGTFTSSTSDGGFRTVPQGISIDTTHNYFYVGDNNSMSATARVQRFVLSTGAYSATIGRSTVAAGTCVVGAQAGWCTGGTYALGTADGVFLSPKPSALDITNDRLYVGDGGRVQKFVLSTGAFISANGTKIVGTTTWANLASKGTAASGTGDGSLTAPYGVAVDLSGDRMYVPDYSAYRVNKFVLSTGLFVGSIGNSVVASGTCVVGKQSGWCTGGSFASAAVDGTFTGPQGIAIDTTNDRMYIVDGGTSARVEKFVLSTGAYVGSIGYATSTTGTCVASSKQASWCTGGNFVLTTPDGAFSHPTGIVLDVAGNHLFVADTFNYRVQEFALSSGAYVGSIGNSTAGPCTTGAQTTWCAGGSYITGTGDGMFSSPQGLAIDVTGDRLYVGDYSRVQKFVLSTGAFSGAIGNSTAHGTCVAGAQTAWCTQGIFSVGTGDGMFNGPGLVLDSAADTLFVADYTNNRIQRITLSTGASAGSIGKSTASGTCAPGAQSTWCTGGVFSAGTGDGMFSTPSAVAVNPAGKFLYITNITNARIERVYPYK